MNFRLRKQVRRPATSYIKARVGLFERGLQAVLLFRLALSAIMSRASSPTPSHSAPGNLLPETQALLFGVKPSSLLKLPIINRGRVRW